MSLPGINNSPFSFNPDRLVQQLLAEDRQQIKSTQERIKEKQDTRGKFNELNNKVRELQDASEVLTEPETFQKKTAESSNSDALEATVADPEQTTSGTKEVFVEQLAETASVESGKFINDQKMFGTGGDGNGASSISDFEQVQGLGTVDVNNTNSTSEMLDELSKNVDSNSEFEITVDPDDNNSGSDGNQEQTMTVDISDYNSFSDMMNDVNSTLDRLSMQYDRNRDKFFFVPTNQTGDGNDGDAPQNETPGGTTFELQDTTGNFLKQIGVATDGDGTVHEFDKRQSQGAGSRQARNLLTINNIPELTTSELTTTPATVRINNTEITVDQNVNDDTNPSTIQEFVDEVSQEVTGVEASFNKSTDKIRLETTETGQGEIDVEDVGSGNLADTLNLRTESSSSDGQVQASEDKGQDSEITYNGSTITDSDNSLNVEGLRLNLKSLYQESNNSSDPIELNVEDANNAISSDVKSFVDKFNNMIGFINKNSQENAPDSVDSSDSNKSGPFLGDSSVRLVKDRLTRTITDRFNDAVTSGNKIENTSDVGIELVNPIDSGENEAGKLNFDRDKFKEAISENPEQVQELFTAKEDESSRGGDQDGVLVQVNDFLSSQTGGDGVISSRIDGFSNSIDSLNDRIDRQEERLKEKRERQKQRFRRIGQTLSRLQDQQQSLQRALG